MVESLSADGAEIKKKKKKNCRDSVFYLGYGNKHYLVTLPICKILDSIQLAVTQTMSIANCEFRIDHKNHCHYGKESPSSLHL